MLGWRKLTQPFCTGLIYELLYGEVFGMEDIDLAIQVMLYEGKPAKEPNGVCFFQLHSLERSFA